MKSYLSMAWETHVEPPRIPSISSNRLHDHTTTGTWVTHIGINIQLQCTRIDTQSIIWPSERRITWCRSPLDWMYTRQEQDIPILTTYHGNRKHHHRFPLTEFSHVRPDTHRKYQPNTIITDSGIDPHQTASQKHYILYIIACGRLKAYNGIAKATVTKQSGNWNRWFTFLKHSGISDKFLAGILQEQRKILVLSFAASVRRNQFGTTRKQILLRGNVKSAISDLSAFFWTHLQSNRTLESSDQTFLLLQRQLRCYKEMDRTTKHQKAKLENPVLHIYRQAKTYMNTAISQLITGSVFFGMRSCKYSTTPKVEGKHTCILQEGDIHFTGNATKFHTTAGPSIWLIRSPWHSAHIKALSKRPQWHNFRQPRPSAFCAFGTKPSSYWTHTQ